MKNGWLEAESITDLQAQIQGEVQMRRAHCKQALKMQGSAQLRSR
jgi:hypothetical protein